MEEFNLKLEVLEVYTGFDRNMMLGVFKLTVMLLDSHSHHWSHYDVFWFGFSMTTSSRIV